jgi:hypothetical protein
MIVTAWNNGQHHPTGAGYGLKIDAADRERHFRREWKTVALVLEGGDAPVKVNVGKPSFWGKTCRELISAEIGRWLMKNGLAPWPKGHPPRLALEPLGEAGRFLLKKQQ